MKKYDFFISHHQSDSGAEASLLAETLRNRGFTVFLDVDTHQAGDLTEITRDALSASRAIVVIVGRTFGKRVDSRDDWVRRELVFAENLGKRVVPVYLDREAIQSNELPGDLQWFASLRGLNYDRARVTTLVEELSVAFRLRPRATQGPSLSFLIVMVAIAVALGLSISYSQSKDGELSIERTKREAAEKRIGELKDEIDDLKQQLLSK